MQDISILSKEDELSNERNRSVVENYFVRLNFNERVQHVIFVTCFLILVITGFMLKIPEITIRQIELFFTSLGLGGFGGMIFSYRSLLHRTAGTVMMIVSAYHVYYLIFVPAGRRLLLDMLPKFKDLTDMIHNILYYLGLKKDPPAFDRFCYKHKSEYAALVAGNTIMAITGPIMWTEYLWNKFVIDVATLFHGYEAITASLAIMVWHLYEVHLRPHKFPIDYVFLTGIINEEEMKEEFGLHYEKIMADPELQEIYLKKIVKE